MRWLIKGLLSLGVFAGLIWLDIWWAARQDARILRNAADFETRMAEVTLDFEGPPKQGCEITRVALFNAYQTCFNAWYQDQQIAGFTYIYHRPRALSAFYGKRADSFYFSHVEYGQRLKEIPRDGPVNHLYTEDLRDAD